MSGSSKMVKHTGIMMFMELGIRLLDALVSVILARYLGPHGFGLMAFAIAFPSMFSIVVGFGMGAFITRDLARDPSQMSRYVSNGIILKILLALLTLAVVYIFSLVLHLPHEKSVLVFMGTLLMIFEGNTRFILSVFQGYQKMTIVAVVNLTSRIGWVLLSIGLIFFKAGINELLAVRVLLYGVTLVVSVFLIDRRIERIKWSLDWAFIWKMMKASFPFALFRLFGGVYTDIDTVMLSSMRGDVMTGWYAAAYKILRIFAFIPSGVFQGVMPAYTKLSNKNPEDILEVLERSIKYLLICVFPICGAISLLAKPLTVFIYGNRFSQASGALQILSWSLVFTFLNSALNASIAAQGQEKQGSWIMFSGLAASALSNLVAIPLWGYLGAAATTIFTEGIVFFMQVRLVAKKIPGLRIWRQSGKSFAAMLFMIAVAWPWRHLNIFFGFAICGVSYFLGLIVLGVMTTDEWKEIKKMTLAKLSKGKNKPVVAIAPRKDERLLKPGITVHCRVRNEEAFVREMILSILPLAEQVLVCDTGSTDSTLEKIKSIGSGKIEMMNRPPSDPRGIMEYRNEMIERTETEWFMLVDGDEVYPDEAALKIHERIKTVPEKIARILVHRFHFVAGYNFISGKDTIGRIYRTREIRWRLYDDRDNRVGHETPYLIEEPAKSVEGKTMKLPENIFFFHGHYLSRSSRDAELGRLRSWRQSPYPVYPYFGPWPSFLDVSSASRKMTAGYFVRWLKLLAQGMFASIFLVLNPKNKKLMGSTSGAKIS